MRVNRYWTWINRAKNRFSLLWWSNPHKPLASLVIFNRRSEKKRGIGTQQYFTAAAIPRLTRHGSPPDLGSVCSPKLMVLAAKFVGRRRSGSRGFAWNVGTWPSCVSTLCYKEQEVITDHINNHPEMGQAPTSQAWHRDTDHLTPSNLAAGTLSLVGHMSCKVTKKSMWDLIKTRKVSAWSLSKSW